MNRYKIGFKVMQGETLIGEYTAHVEAESAGAAERRAIDELEKANIGSRHHYLTNRIWDLGQVKEEEEEEGPL